MNNFKLKNIKTGRVFNIVKSEATIGRDTTCDVVLALGYPSRFHAKISVQNDTFVLEDLQSTNGTFVNDQRLTCPATIKTGDIIKFSTEAFSFKQIDHNNTPGVSGKLPSKPHDAKLIDAHVNDTIIRRYDI